MLKFFLFLFLIALVFRAFMALFGIRFVKIFAREAVKNAQNDFYAQQNFHQQQGKANRTQSPPFQSQVKPQNTNQVEDIDFEEIK